MKIEIVQHTPPILELSVEGTLIRVFGVLKVDDRLIGKLDGLTDRYGVSEGIRDWIHLEGLQVLSMEVNDLVILSKYEAANRLDISIKTLMRRLRDGTYQGNELNRQNIMIDRKHFAT